VSAIRHAHAAIAHGRGDAMALTLGGFVVAMVEHDRGSGFEALEAALKLSPSYAFTYHLGSIPLALAGEGARAIEWGERALRLSPLDPSSYVPGGAIALGHFQQGRYEESANAARKAIQANPGFSISHMFFTAPLVKLGRMDEAKAAAARVLALQPGFTTRGFCAAVGIHEGLGASLSEALRAAGLPD
jgi:adenylate cyclase